MRVFVIPSIYPSKKYPEQGSFIKEQTLALKQYGHEIIVLDASVKNYKDWLKPDCWIPNFSNEDGINRITLNTRAYKSSKYPEKTIKACCRNAELLYDKAIQHFGAPDILLAHFSFTGGFCARNISKKYQIPFVVIEHGSLLLDDKLDISIKAGLKDLVMDSAAFVCVSNYLKDRVVSLTNNSNIVVIPNMVDKAYRYYPVNRDKEKIVFFSAGNLFNTKGFSLLINAFVKAFSSNDNVQLLIAGSGPEERTLNDMIHSTHREKQIFLLGQKNRVEMLEQYKNSDCFVLLSEFETFGIVYREAMAVGRPIISTDNGGIRENWDDENGVIIQDKSIDAVANELILMRNDLENNRYDYHSISDRTMKLYSSEATIGCLNHLLRKSLSKN